MDFYGPLPTSTGGVKQIFDRCVKLVSLYPIKRATTAVIIKKIFEHYCKEIVKPKKLILTTGPVHLEEIASTSRGGNPAHLLLDTPGNVVERVNRELGKFFRILIKNHHTA